MSKSRADRAKALEEWAERVESSDLSEADTEALRMIAELAERRQVVEEELTEAVRSARQAQRSWSEIGTMLGVSQRSESTGRRSARRQLTGTMAALAALNLRCWD